MLLKIKVDKYSVIFLSVFIALMLFFASKVEASYGGCNNKIANTELYDCGSAIYTYYEDKEHSSSVRALGDNSVLYAGKIDGMDVFYVNGFEYYNVTYDDTSSTDNNMWAVITSRGEEVYDGSFKDSWLIDDSHSGRYMDFLFNKVYTIRQYRNDGDLYRTIVLYNYHQGAIEFLGATYDGNAISDVNVNEVLASNKQFKTEINSMYGVKSSEVTINGVDVDSRIDGSTVIIDNEILNEKMTKGEVNTIEVSVKDFFGKRESKKYKLLFVNDEVLIEFSTMDSLIATTSRRILINARAGKGKSLDTDYCWYYWSESPDDSLAYEEFIKNYAASGYKGSYSEDKGVILRNTSGTYYLYALAKDEDSVMVKRSEGYTLNGTGYKVSYNLYDVIFVVAVALCGIIPIVIYLYIRKKGY